jgi:hypothetical protein
MIESIASGGRTAMRDPVTSTARYFIQWSHGQVSLSLVQGGRAEPLAPTDAVAIRLWTLREGHHARRRLWDRIREAFRGVAGQQDTPARA